MNVAARGKPSICHLLLNGHQAASFPISAEDFHSVMELLGEDTEALPVVAPIVETLDGLAALEAKYIKASVEVKTRLGKCVERAKAINELHFAIALMPEMRGMQDG